MTEITIPLTLNDERFTKAWQEYLDYRRERRLPKLLARSQQKQLDRLADYGVEVAIEAINQTVANGWQGLFPHRVQAPVAAGVGRLHSSGVGASSASLGALQMQRKALEEELSELLRPGGTAWNRTLTLEQSGQAERLRAQLKAVKERIACL